MKKILCLFNQRSDILKKHICNYVASVDGVFTESNQKKVLIKWIDLNGLFEQGNGFGLVRMVVLLQQAKNQSSKERKLFERGNWERRKRRKRAASEGEMLERRGIGKCELQTQAQRGDKIPYFYFPLLTVFS